jgi:hypothetical protein
MRPEEENGDFVATKREQNISRGLETKQKEVEENEVKRARERQPVVREQRRRPLAMFL